MGNNININIKKSYPNARLPYKATEGAAGFDLYAAIKQSITIPAGDSRIISTGIEIEIPNGYWGGLYIRSGLAVKKGLRLSNSTGVIDADFRGTIMAKLHNDSRLPQTIEPNERICQLIIQPYLPCELQEVAELTNTVRGIGGFGSTGLS